ncbi:Uncharacterized protein Rs2_02840 [Raphanus sativus]|nr:Uncharacterized protein Rs2_02840 [Raphanus sativus]
MERRRAEMESSVAGPSATSVVPTLGSDVTLTPDSAALVLGPDVTPISISTLPASGPDVPLPAGEIVVSEQVPDVQARPEDSPFVPIVVSEDAVEVIPPLQKRRGDRFGFRRPTLFRHRGDVQELGLSERRGKGVLGVRKARFRRDYRSIAPRLWTGGYTFVQGAGFVAGNSEAYRGVLQSIESTHAAQTSTLEARISDLEHDLGKTVSSLLKAKEEKKSKSSEVRRSEIPEVQDAEIVADKGGEEVARVMAKLFLPWVNRRMKAVSRRTPRLFNP